MTSQEGGGRRIVTEPPLITRPDDAHRKAIPAASDGRGKVRDALCRFARRYADQTERDHEALLRAIRAGRLSDAPPADVSEADIG